MTLDEAITHANDVASGCGPCAEDHRQLAEWLSELRTLKNPSPPNRTPSWWFFCLVHNWLVHPLMPLADLLDTMGERRVSSKLYALHDNSFPQGGG